MQYKSNKKIIIDKRKLDTVIRLGCPSDVLLCLITTGTVSPTGDSLIDENLESMREEKEFTNWGGNHNPTGKNQYSNKKSGQLDGQKRCQLDRQDDCQVVDKDIDKDLKIKEVNKKEIYKERFEEWWSFYPKLRAGNKQKAFDKYIKAVENEKLTPEWLLEKVKEYSNSEEVKKGYACGAEVYFNKCKYNNDYSELNEKEETVFIDEHTRIDEQMPEFNDMTFEECCRAFDWLQEQMYCQSISKSKFVEIVRKFKGSKE